MRFSDPSVPAPAWANALFGVVATLLNLLFGSYTIAVLAVLWCGYLTVEAYRYHRGWRRA